MQVREIPIKNKIVYIVAVCFITLLLWLSNEGARPLVYTGTKLQHSVGLIDSESSLVLSDSVAVNGVVASTPRYVMNKGSYTAQLDYTAEEEGSVLELWEQGRKVAAWEIDPLQPRLVADFTLSKDAKQLQMQINYSGKGMLTLKKLSLTPSTMFYSDTFFVIAVFLVCSLLGWKLFVERSIRLTQEQLVDYGIILGVALLATTPLMQTYLYNGDDLCYHLARLEGLKDGILDGQIPVNIQPDGLSENGYLNAMYPYLFLYIGAFLRICRVSIALSYKVLIFLANLGSAVCAYVAVKSMCKSRRSVILAVVLYTLMPYRFTNIFSRGDLGETLALIFWPFVIAGMYHIVMGERKKWYYLVIGFSGILHSHILSAVFVLAICLVTALVWCVRIVREKRYIEIGKAAGISVILNMWYLVPFMYYYFGESLNTETLRWSGYFEQSINPSNLTQSFSPYNKQYFALGLALLGCVGIGIIRFLCERDKKRTDKDGYLLYLLVMGCVLTYMITGYFPSKALLSNELFENILTMIQFPWRFLGPASACFVFVGAIGLSDSHILKPYRNMIFTLLIGLNLLIIVSVPSDNSHMPYENAEAEASKGHESKLAANIGLFYPHEWRIEGASDDKLTFSVIVSEQNSASIRQYQKKGTKAVVVYTADKECYIELPIQSYFGYRAYDEEGNRLTIERGTGARMRFTVQGDGQEHTIHVRYGPNPVFIIANLISALAIAYIVWQIYKRRRGSQESSAQAI
ncbi:MAG: hypothetical protein K2L82_00630 [Lachnospiraceae bacterium]|nr:hypothetical protein [Lachnospiraceae bacterium]